ncbi:hypothetical protein SELMODRAFT_416119 [Selaginella moellendorffii]|uniref:CHAT domain-containing protein n=1 Tax=Selaginella moellendorffii TaxID=88036 RepID=D8RY53_SELML|nr:uncharacterized protein LOC9645826 [Selaginella moellendorffii]EFJ23039.1 hypothetical protein SELMODRAFT_416119 [Selaginella moellendorffii]|eukprot:XP_002976134.1 uncharacterized protein LOC9645826 [Selaginella moellendorffii]
MVVLSNCTDVSGFDFENVFEQRRHHFFTSATLRSFTGGMELALPWWILPPMLYHSPDNYDIRTVVPKATEDEGLFMMHDHLGNSWQLDKHLLKQHEEALSSIHAPMVRALKMMKKLSYTEAVHLFRLACERMWPCHRKMSLGLWVLLHLGHASLRAAMVAEDASKGHLLLQQALEALGECVDNAKATTLHSFNRSVLFSATVGMAWVYFFKGDPSRAMRLVRESQGIVVDRRALSARADCNLDLVWALIAFHTVWGDLKEVQAYLSRLGYFFSQTEDEYHIGAMEIHIEAVLKGNLNTGFYIACKYLAKGRLIFHPLRDADRSEILPEHLHALTCGMLGDIWFALGINSEAMLAYEKAYVEDNLLLRAGSLVGKANVCMRMLGEGDANYKDYINKAKQSYEEAFNIYEGLGHKTGMAIVHCNLGSLHQEKEHFERALQHFTMAREAFVVDVLGLDCRVAQLEVLRGDLDAAVVLFQRSLDSLDPDKPMLVAWMKHQVGLCFLRAHHRGKGKGSDALMKAKNNLVDAVKIFAKVQFTMTTTPPLMFVVFEGQKATYRLLEWCFATEGKAMEAFVWAERGRSRLLMQERWDDVIEHYRLDDRKTLEALGSRAFDSLSYDSAWTCLMKWRHFCSLQSKAAIVEYTVCSDFGIITYVLDGNSKPKVSCRAFRDLGPELASGKKFEAFINTSVDTIVHGSQSQANECLTKLYDLLLRPVEVHLKRLNQLVIVPHEVLFKVPFAALIHKTGSFLIQKYRLSLADSVRSLIRSSMLTRQHQASRQAEGNANMLIVGIGNHSAVGEANLAFAEREAQQVAHILKKGCGEKLVVLLGDNATKKEVLGNIRMSSVVHLATHAMVTNKHEQGAILLSAAGRMQADSIMSWPSNPSIENRAVDAMAVLRSTEKFQQTIEITREVVMDAEELSRMVLSADLMVLSACQTGRGVIAGEGVAGLGRAVCTAGVACSVLSLWPVGDEATCCLMETFYQELVAHSKDVGSAMQTSMVRMIEEKARFGGSRWTVDSWAAFLPFGLPTVTIDKS